jgi:hypothetical protein
MGHQFEELSSEVIAAAIEVHKALGPGFVEPMNFNAPTLVIKRVVL